MHGVGQFWQLSIFTGPVAKAHPGWGDGSYFVGFAVAVVLYLLTFRLKPLWVRHPRATSSPAASSPVASAADLAAPAEEQIR